jgi:hypothetical protein
MAPSPLESASAGHGNRLQGSLDFESSPMGNTVQNGKGSRPRPTDPQKWAKGFDVIKWPSKRKRKVKTK